MQVEWLSIVALAGWLVLAVSAYRSRNIPVRKTLTMAAAWGALTLVVALAFTALG